MRIYHKNTPYDTIYSPFFRISSCSDFAIYGLRFPSGKIDEIVVFDQDDYIVEMKSHLMYLLTEYALEDDDMLTEKAKELKADVRSLFGIE